MNSVKYVMAKIKKDPRFFPESSELETSLYLQALVRLVQPKNILEIGTFLGYTTCSMSLALQKNSLITTVDSSQDFKKYYLILPKNVQKRINVVNSKSDIYLCNKNNKMNFDLIFIDASHDFFNVYSDFANSLTHISANSIYVFHDSNSPGVYKTLLIMRLLNFVFGYGSLSVIKLDTPEKPEIFVMKKKGEIPFDLSCKSGLAVVTVYKSLFYPIFYNSVQILLKILRKVY